MQKRENPIGMELALSELRSLRKLLVANRGEIALRVMKTAKKMGLLTVAVYTDADEQSPHVNFADQSVNIGKGPIASLIFQ